MSPMLPSLHGSDYTLLQAQLVDGMHDIWAAQHVSRSPLTHKSSSVAVCVARQAQQMQH